MNEYKIDDLRVGMTESFKKKISDEMLNSFYNLTGDENPLHLDGNFARAHGFKDRVVYGLLTSSFISTLGGCYLPGKYCLIQGVETKYLRPVFSGDEITVIGEIVDIRAELNYVEIKVTMKNQNDEKVLRGMLKVGLLNEE